MRGSIKYLGASQFPLVLALLPLQLLHLFLQLLHLLEKTLGTEQRPTRHFEMSSSYFTQESRAGDLLQDKTNNQTEEKLNDMLNGT